MAELPLQSLLGDEFIPGAAQGESPACSAPTLQSVNRPRTGLWLYRSARQPDLCQRSVRRQTVFVNRRGLERTDLSVGTFHTVTFFSLFKILFLAVLGLAARAPL